VKRATITDAKNHLSSLLAEVRSGETIVIMDRGVPIARLESLTATESAGDGRLARLRRSGAVRPAEGEPHIELLLSPPPASRAGSSLTQALLDERREGR